MMRPRLQSSALDPEPANTSAMDPATDVTSFLGINPEGDDEALAAGEYGPTWTESDASAAPYATFTLIRTSLAFVLNSVPVLGIVLLTTVYLLFANDIRLLAFSASADVVFEVLSSACLFVFLLELVMRSWVETELSLISVPNRSGKIPVSMAARTMDAGWRALCCGRRRRLRVHGYAFSILFLLDVVAVISILPEIRWIWGDQSVVSSNLSTTRASRAARVGARLGRIIRVVRVVRITRLFSGQAHVVRESRIGYHLTTSTTRTVILLVLLTLLLIPLFSWAPSEFGPQLAALLVHDANLHRADAWEATVASVIGMYSLQSALAGSGAFLPSDLSTPLLVRLVLSPAAGVESSLLVDRSDVYSGLRVGAWSELAMFSYSDVNAATGTVATTTVWFNLRPLQRVASLFSIFVTIFILILLTGGALQFSTSAQLLVLRPIERMLEFVERIAVNPTADASSSRGESEVTYETQLLENVIKKIVGILRVGFGAAGMRLVANHVSSRRKVPNATVATPDTVLSHVRGVHTGRRLSKRRLSLVRTGDPSTRLIDVAVHASTGPTIMRYPWRAQFSPGRRFVAGDVAAGAGLFDPFRSGRKVRAILVRVCIPHFSAICDLLGERAVTYNNLIAKCVHDTVLAWDGAVLSNEGGEFSCAWVIDDAWDTLFSDSRTRAYIRTGALAAPASPMPLSPRSPRTLLPDAFSASSVASPEDGRAAASPAPQVPPPPPPSIAMRRVASLGAAIIGEEAPAENSRSAGEDRSVRSENPVAALVRHASVVDVFQDSSAGPGWSPSRRVDAAVLRRRSSARYGVSPRGDARSELTGAAASVAVEAPSSMIMFSAGDSHGIGSLPSGRLPRVSMMANEGDGDAEASARSRAVAVLADKAREVADMALAACLKMVVAVRRNRDLARSPELAALRASTRLRGLRQDLAIGMHASWAVECAVGTGHKVNPALLSPESGTAARLACVAPYYGANVLLSGTVHSLLSTAVQPHCRLVDVLDVQPGEGATTPPSSRVPVLPLPVFMYDSWDWRTAPAPPLPSPGEPSAATPDAAPQGPQQPPLLPFAAFGSALIADADVFNTARTGLQEHERCISLLGEADIIEHPVAARAVLSAQLFDVDPELRALRLEHPPAYRSAVEAAVRAYLRGDWASATAGLERVALTDYRHQRGPQPAAPSAQSPRTSVESVVGWRRRLDTASLRVLQAMEARAVTGRASGAGAGRDE